MRRPARPRARILVVDDNASSRAMLGLALRRAGFAVETADGGDTALEMLGRRDYDWLVTDAAMAPMSGFELASAAREARPGLRIVMVSAVFTDADIGGTPVEKVFGKPIALEALVDWLGRR